MGAYEYAYNQGFFTTNPLSRAERTRCSGRADALRVSGDPAYRSAQRPTNPLSRAEQTRCSGCADAMRVSGDTEAICRECATTTNVAKHLVALFSEQDQRAVRPMLETEAATRMPWPCQLQLKEAEVGGKAALLPSVALASASRQHDAEYGCRPAERGEFALVMLRWEAVLLVHDVIVTGTKKCLEKQKVRNILHSCQNNLLRN